MKSPDRRKLLPLTPDNNMINAAYMLIETMSKGTPERHKRIVARVWEEMARTAPEARSTGLTKNQMIVHEVIADYVQEFGKAPSLREIGQQVGKDQSAIHRMIKSMQRRGVLEFEHGRRRSIRLLSQPGEHIKRRLISDK